MATRDNLGFAMKATYCEVDGVGKEIFKDPKTVIGMPKRSLRGLIEVNYNQDGRIKAYDQVSQAEEECGLLKTVFENGKIVRVTTLDEIRKKLNETA